MQCDEVVRPEDRAGVVERARALLQREGSQPERLGEPEARLARVLCPGRDRRPGAVELLRPSRTRERLERVHAEPALVRVERRQRRRAADVRDPLAMSKGQSLGRGRDGRVRDAQQDELCVLAQLHAALLEARCDGRTDAAATDHVD